MPKTPPRLAAVLTAALLLATQGGNVFSQHFEIASLTTTKTKSSRPTGTAISPEAAVAQFVASEAKVREALNQHTFKRDVTLQTIGPNGEVTGEYVRNSQFVFDNNGRRIERVIFHPKSTISEMRITKEDIQDLAGAQLLGIDITETGKYNLSYVGLETVDSQQLIGMDVTPQVAPDPNHMSERFFVGRIWLDPNTYQIVKIRGVVEPQGKQRFPLFETWRAAVKGPLAFPVRTEADDVLHFRERDVHYRIKVRYYDYQLFGSRVSVTEVGGDVPEGSAPPKELLNSPSPRNNDIDLNKPPAPPVLKKSSGAGWGISSTTELESCQENRDAPPVGMYHWPAGATVKVFFIRNLFTPEQRTAALEAMAVWTGASSEIASGVTFVDAGDTDTRQTCESCLTIRRKDVLKQDRHHYAFFYPMNRVDRLLISAWIDLDFGIKKPEALKSFMAHELGHGMGLWDCESCKKKRTIMNAFPGLNKDNGLQAPSRCDLAIVRGVYQEERMISRAANASGMGNTNGSSATSLASGAAVGRVNLPLATASNEPRPVSQQIQIVPGQPSPRSFGSAPHFAPERPATSVLSLFDIGHANFSNFSGWRKPDF